jgi:hypothetical protein
MSDRLAEIVTQDVLNTTSDDMAPQLECTLDAIDDYGMSDYLEAITCELAEKFGLTQEQEDELANRISWRLVLLPKQPS